MGFLVVLENGYASLIEGYTSEGSTIDLEFEKVQAERFEPSVRLPAKADTRPRSGDMFGQRRNRWRALGTKPDV
jgi:hypothetical protein